MADKFKELLKLIWVLQEDFAYREHPIGGGYNYKVRRINPFSPLSYIILFLGVITGFFLYGIVGFWDVIDIRNPFKWI